jgi:hypothetical protein
MSRAPRQFKQSDVTALIKAVENAGKSVVKVELETNGKITIFVAGRDDGAAPIANPWEALADEEVRLRSKL